MHSDSDVYCKKWKENLRREAKSNKYNNVYARSEPKEKRYFIMAPHILD